MTSHEVLPVRAGFLFVGDPHLDDIKPGRRLDHDFAETILEKLDFCIDHCNEHDLQMVILGDLFDNRNIPQSGQMAPVRREKRDLPTKLINRTIRRLVKLKYRAICNVGNHDKENDVLTDEDSLMVLKNSGVLDVCTDSGPVQEYMVNGKRVGLGATPYGQAIPTDVRGYFPDAEKVIWITHHDLAFDGPYPGSQPIFPIKGCTLVVNGHMHLYKKPLQIGTTIWFNPGNITRQFLDALEHIPSVFKIGATPGLQRVVVPHEKAIFNLTGKFIDPVSPGEKPGEKAVSEYGNFETDFVTLLASEDSLEMERSDDGSILYEEIKQKFERDKTNEDIQGLVNFLFVRTIEKAQSEAA